MLVEMSRCRLAVVVCVLVALHVTVAGLPHEHADQAVRVGALHLDHGEAAGDGSGVMPPLEVVAGAACLACAVHAPQLSAPTDVASPIGMAAARRSVDLDRPAVTSPRRGRIRLRGPPPVV